MAAELGERKLNLYNDALLQLGERPLASTEDSPLRDQLDQLTANGRAVEYCLELIKPDFAAKRYTSTIISTIGVGNFIGYAGPCDLEADYVCILEVHIGQQMDNPTTRYIIEGNTIYIGIPPTGLSDPDDLQYQYRYISNLTAEPTESNIALWSQSFYEAVVARLAYGLSVRRTPDDIASAMEAFEKAAQLAAQIEQGKRPQRRAKKARYQEEFTSAQRVAWVLIYNDALNILGLETISDFDDQSERSLALHTARNAGVIQQCVNITGWQWALKAVLLQGVATDTDQSTPTTTDDTVYEYDWRFTKPADFLRIWGVYRDRDLLDPLEHYADEGDYIYATEAGDELMMQYIPDTFANDLSTWPVHFARFVAAEMAMDARHMAKDPQQVAYTYQMRRRDAEQIDVMSSPPRKLARGNWLRSRQGRGRNDYRDYRGP